MQGLKGRIELIERLSTVEGKVTVLLLLGTSNFVATVGLILTVISVMK